MTNVLGMTLGVGFRGWRALEPPLRDGGHF